MSGHSGYPSLYGKTYAALVALLGITVVVAHFNFGSFNMIASLSVAVTKATLVLLIFMHVRESSKTIWVYVGAGFFWLFLLLLLSMGDYLTR